MHQASYKSLLKSYISFRFASNYLEVDIETERLFIQSYKDTDFQNCISLYSNENITKYFDHGKARNKLEIENLISEKGKKYFSNGKPFGLFSIFHKQDMTFIGQIDFLPSEELGIAEIGFILNEQYHNQGFCSEAVNAIAFDYVEAINTGNFKCDELFISKVIATVHPENSSSRKVLQKTGMTLDKIQERFGQPRLWYSIPVSSITKNSKTGSQWP